MSDSTALATDTAAPAPAEATVPPAAAAAPPAPDLASEQQLADAEKTAQHATAERDELLAALRKVLDPSGAAGEQAPAALAEQATVERDAALAEARRLRVELAAHQAAHKSGADPARLLDSRSVERQLAELDPSAQKFGERLDAVIAAAVEANPLLRAEQAPTGPAKGGADFTPGAAPVPTAEQFARMSYGERVELHQSDPDLYARLSAASQ
ncbi:Ku protein [Streptomyces sp. NBRC 110611]|uniref:hypothetical protein n=1 Tax=Streptomyces sp. NBRC 110611 TaxID=1621259 RepID=UPI00082FD1B4|nr:hypothetical protein [Streptomyces sp. NBRC 110611]GAU67679.1 Ku protein [Streptomyces sp. NBRC 110611]